MLPAELGFTPFGCDEDQQAKDYANVQDIIDQLGVMKVGRNMDDLIFRDILDNNFTFKEVRAATAKAQKIVGKGNRRPYRILNLAMHYAGCSASHKSSINQWVDQVADLKEENPKIRAEELPEIEAGVFGTKKFMMEYVGLLNTHRFRYDIELCELWIRKNYPFLNSSSESRSYQKNEKKNSYQGKTQHYNEEYQDAFGIESYISGIQTDTPMFKDHPYKVNVHSGFKLKQRSKPGSRYTSDNIPFVRQRTDTGPDEYEAADGDPQEYQEESRDNENEESESKAKDEPEEERKVEPVEFFKIPKTEETGRPKTKIGLKKEETEIKLNKKQTATRREPVVSKKFEYQNSYRYGIDDAKDNHTQSIGKGSSQDHYDLYSEGANKNYCQSQYPLTFNNSQYQQQAYSQYPAYSQSYNIAQAQTQSYAYQNDGYILPASYNSYSNYPSYNGYYMQSSYYTPPLSSDPNSGVASAGPAVRKSPTANLYTADSAGLDYDSAEYLAYSSAYYQNKFKRGGSDF